MHPADRSLAGALIGGAQLAIKGAELQKDIRKADAQLAVDTPFEKAWDACLTTLVNLDIEQIAGKKTAQGDGGLFEGVAKKTKIRVVMVKLTEEITELVSGPTTIRHLQGSFARGSRKKPWTPDSPPRT